MSRGAIQADLELTLDTRSLNTSVREVRQALGRISGSASEFQKSLDASTARVFAFGATTAVIASVGQAFKQLVSTTFEVEKRLVEIKAIFGGTAQEFAKFRESIFDIAKKTGQSFDEVSKGAAEFARQGLTAAETSKRLEAALVLTNVAGLDSVKSVNAITASLNGFTSAGLTAQQVTNKLVAIDTAFAISSGDLAEALSRAGSSAEDAGVSFDQFLGLVTAVEQRTKRGGAVIANGLKTIFTRLQRSTTIEELQNLGVAIDASQNGVQKLQAISSALDSVADPTKASQIKELAAGVFQINILSAALKDLSDTNSIFSDATLKSINAGNDGYEKNAEIVNTLTGNFNKLVQTLTNLGEKVGQSTFAPLLKNLISIGDKAAGFLDRAFDPENGSKLIQGLFGAISTFISGPGLVLIVSGFIKIFRLVAKFAGEGLGTVLKIGTETERIKSVQSGLIDLLRKDEALSQQILGHKVRESDAVEAITQGIIRNNQRLKEQEDTLLRISTLLSRQGVANFTDTGLAVDKKGKPIKGKAGGYTPSFGEVMVENIAAQQNGYKAGKVFNTRIYDGQGGSFESLVNSAETIKTVRGPNGKLGTYVIPPNGKKKRMSARGYDPSFRQKTRETFNAQSGKTAFAQSSINATTLKKADEAFKDTVTDLEFLQKAIKETSKGFSGMVTYSKQAQREVFMANSPHYNPASLIDEYSPRQFIPSSANPSSRSKQRDFKFLGWNKSFRQKEKAMRPISDDPTRSGSKLIDGFSKITNATSAFQVGMFSASAAVDTFTDSNKELNQQIQTLIGGLAGLQLLLAVVGPLTGNLLKVSGLLKEFGGGIKPFKSGVGGVGKAFGSASLASKGGVAALVVGAAAAGAALGVFANKLLKLDYGRQADELQTEESRFALKASQIKFQDKIARSTVTSALGLKGLNKQSSKTEIDNLLYALNTAGEGGLSQKIQQQMKSVTNAATPNEAGDINGEELRKQQQLLTDTVKEARKALTLDNLGFSQLKSQLEKFNGELEKVSTNLRKKGMMLEIASGVNINSNSPNASLVDNTLSMARGEVSVRELKNTISKSFSGEEFKKILAEEGNLGALSKSNRTRLEDQLKSPQFVNKLSDAYKDNPTMEGLRKALFDLTGGVSLDGSEESAAFLSKLEENISSFGNAVISTRQGSLNALDVEQDKKLEIERQIVEITREKLKLETSVLTSLPSRLKELFSVGQVDPLTLSKGFQDVAKTKDPLEAARKLSSLTEASERFKSLRGENALAALQTSSGLSLKRERELREASALSNTKSPRIRELLTGVQLSKEQRGFVSTGVGDKNTMEEIARKLESLSKAAGRPKNFREDAASAASAIRANAQGETDQNQEARKNLDEQLKESNKRQEELNFSITSLKTEMDKFKNNLGPSKLLGATDLLDQKMRAMAEDMTDLKTLSTNMTGVKEMLNKELTEMKAKLATIGQ